MVHTLTLFDANVNATICYIKQLPILLYVLKMKFTIQFLLSIRAYINNFALLAHFSTANLKFKTLVLHETHETTFENNVYAVCVGWGFFKQQFTTSLQLQNTEQPLQSYKVQSNFFKVTKFRPTSFSYKIQNIFSKLQSSEQLFQSYTVLSNFYKVTKYRTTSSKLQSSEQLLQVIKFRGTFFQS